MMTLFPYELRLVKPALFLLTFAIVRLAARIARRCWFEHWRRRFVSGRVVTAMAAHDKVYNSARYGAVPLALSGPGGAIVRWDFDRRGFTLASGDPPPKRSPLDFIYFAYGAVVGVLGPWLIVELNDLAVSAEHQGRAEQEAAE